MIDDTFLSVTAALDVMAKDALVPWAAKLTAEAAIDDRNIWLPILESKGRDEARKWLSNARYRTDGGRTAAQIGTAVHQKLEDWATFGTIDYGDDELDPFLHQFAAWADIFHPEPVHSERTVFSDRYRYAGTCDLICEIGGTRFICDYKTSAKGKGPYPQVALQLAAYRHAEIMTVDAPRKLEQKRRHYLLSPSERERAVPVPNVDAGLVIHISHDACVAYPVDCGPETFDTFLHVLALARWEYDTSKDAIHNPLHLETPDPVPVPTQLAERHDQADQARTRRLARKNAAPAIPALPHAPPPGPYDHPNPEALDSLRELAAMLGLTEDRVLRRARRIAYDLTEPEPATFDRIDGLVLVSVLAEANAKIAETQAGAA